VLTNDAARYSRWETRSAATPTPSPPLAPARPTRPSEPILVPKLRIQFADFPYLHCSIGQRLFT
jgi:hypothetical protein